ncbi:MAG: protease inhibitor I42 family protein [Acidobacteriia bacterium]|nr:protease inhibitor I42 family protein [Terriglobia bacterium]
MRVMVLTVLAALTIALIAGAAQDPRTLRPVIVTELDAGKTVRVELRGSLVVRLSSNPTTGYQWQVVKSDPAYLQPGSRQGFFEPDPAGGLGAGGRQAFTYKAIRQGNTRLIFHYRRPWEEQDPIRTFTINVQIISLRLLRE